MFAVFIVLDFYLIFVAADLSLDFNFTMWLVPFKNDCAQCLSVWRRPYWLKTYVTNNILRCRVWQAFFPLDVQFDSAPGHPALLRWTASDVTLVGTRHRSICQFLCMSARLQNRRKVEWLKHRWSRQPITWIVPLQTSWRRCAGARAFIFLTATLKSYFFKGVIFREEIKTILLHSFTGFSKNAIDYIFFVSAPLQRSCERPHVLGDAPYVSASAMRFMPHHSNLMMKGKK